MSKVLTTTEQSEDVGGKPGLVGPASNMLKDGNSSGPPTLFRHASMQKIRHCCQNLNLFPYLLYSFDNSKSHPVARKVHLCLSRFLHMITARIFFLCKGFRLSLLRGVRGSDEADSQEPIKSAEIREPLAKLCPTERKPKYKQSNPWFLVLAVYLVPLILTFQLAVLFAGVTFFGKITPGYVFLICALGVLSFVTYKVFLQDMDQKVERKIEKPKTN